MLFLLSLYFFARCLSIIDREASDSKKMTGLFLAVNNNEKTEKEACEKFFSFTFDDASTTMFLRRNRDETIRDDPIHTSNLVQSRVIDMAPSARKKVKQKL